MDFQDHFSKQSYKYSKYRPDYPNELIKFITDLCNEKDTALDVATGNGQAAMKIANTFNRIFALDASKNQILNSFKTGNIEYILAKAEKLPVKSNSINLICIAQTLHWFSFEDFFYEVKRVLKADGIIAAWCYNLMKVNSMIDKTIEKFYNDILGDYWPDRRKYIDNEYKTIPFPFNEIVCPPFEISKEWDLEHFLGYLRTWSAVQKYKEASDKDDVEQIFDELTALWENPSKKLKITWPVILRAGINNR